MYLYHGTNSKRLEAIKENGLDPKAQKASSGEDYVYLTDSPEIAARFSGYGPDAMGMLREGYMASEESKKKTGVVLKVKVPDPKKLAKDAIWGKELKNLNGKSAYKKAYDEVAKDFDSGNQVLDFQFDSIMHRLCKQMAEGDEEDFQFFYENPDEDLIERARHILFDRYAKKEQASVQREIDFFKSGKLYQYPDLIPPEAIMEVIPAKKFLKKDVHDRPLGNSFHAYGAAKNDKRIPSTVAKILEEFVRSFGDYGLAPLAQRAQDIILEQHLEYKTVPVYPYYVVHSDARQRWNKQAFKNRYLMWLKRFAETLSKIDKKQYPWISKREILEPFLKIKWDQVTVVSFLDRIDVGK